MRTHTAGATRTTRTGLKALATWTNESHVKLCQGAHMTDYNAMADEDFRREVRTFVEARSIRRTCASSCSARAGTR